ncbi:response regulator transcription factor [Micromonospora echinospora]|uniref:response regulator n=1 Tax=Micromonospora echinospora TaxID=1877 RepID=UPI0033CC67D3
MTDGPLRVLVVDDQQLVREGLTALLELTDGVTVVGAAGDGARALDLVADRKPDVVLMDLRMPVLDGVRATGMIRERFPDVAVVVLTTYADDESIAGALAAGARGYLTKDAGRAEIGMALRAAVTGHAVFDPVVSARLVDAMTRPAQPPTRDRLPDGLTAGRGGAAAPSARARPSTQFNEGRSTTAGEDHRIPPAKVRRP